MKPKNLIIATGLISILAAGTLFYFQTRNVSGEQGSTLSTESAVQLIPLTGPAADPNSELSGLAWHGDWLYLLPQYPERFGEDDGALFRLDGDQIRSYLSGTGGSLTPQPVPFSAAGLKESIPNFQGYEAISFHKDQVYLSIEAGDGTDMHGYLVKGRVDENGVTLDPETLIEVELPIASENHTDEALVIIDDQVLAFYEINGAALNPKPVAQSFDLDLKPLGSIPFPSLEFRVTDAVLEGGEIWVINYFFPGGEIPNPEIDPLALTFGKGATHSRYEHVERVLSLTFEDDRIALSGRAPIQLQLTGDARNWEGLTILDGKGFLMVTDKYPATLLGYVKLP